MIPSEKNGEGVIKKRLVNLLDFLLQDFPVNGFFFINEQGRWQETPQNWPDRVKSEIFFQLKRGNQHKRQDFLEATVDFFEKTDFCLFEKLKQGLRNFSWPLEKLAIRVEELQSQSTPTVSSLLSPDEKKLSLDFLVPFFDLLAIFILKEALKTNVSLPFADWDSQARAINRLWRKKLEELEGSLTSYLSDEEKQQFCALNQFSKNYFQSFLDPLATFIAEEQRISLRLNESLQKLEKSEDKEEIYAAIRETIQPPMGVVANVSPAFFFPALGLLLNPEIEVSSGLQYLTSLIISLFHDSRASDYLLYALETFPPSWTKIRENIIYTLGNLREPRCVPLLAQVLELPDCLEEPQVPKVSLCPLREQKEEAIWALGKIGLISSKVINLLCSYADHPSARLKTYLAWSLGEIGRVQKEKTGGISADILIALLKLLKEKNKEIFEETVSALKKINMPEFIHSLYLYHVGAISLLSLKPAERGLNELSITLNHLISQKEKVVMAVTGDSGTGKTYFCQVLASGCVGLRPEEILYLMRDSKEGRRVFNRLLGRNWLKKYIDPVYYQYDVSDQDKPEVFWQQFLEIYSSKRLILLDGCRDRHYFERVVDLFYEKGELDLVVNFRTNFSTRRLNLEAREIALESVKLHLSFLEEPTIEDTFFYQEGKIILYDLDNSINCRLGREETAELFTKRSVEGWGELIQLGHFQPESFWPLTEEKMEAQEEEFCLEELVWLTPETDSISFQEEILEPQLNKNLDQEPHLLSTVFPSVLEPISLRLYAQDQAGGIDKKGRIFVFTLIDHRLFIFDQEEEIKAECLLGRNFCFQGNSSGLKILSFEREEIANFEGPKIPILKMAAAPPSNLFMVLQNGELWFWNLEEKKIFRLVKALKLPNLINSMALEPGNRLYLANQREVLRFDLNERKMTRFSLTRELVHGIKYLPQKRIAAIVSNRERDKWGIKIVDFQARQVFTLWLPEIKTVSAMECVRDGRLLLSGQEVRTNQLGQSATLPCFLLLFPEKNFYGLARINRQEYRINDILALGPKILTCGYEPNGRASFRLWGSQFFVRTELSKMKIRG